LNIQKEIQSFQKKSYPFKKKEIQTYLFVLKYSRAGRISLHDTNGVPPALLPWKFMPTNFPSKSRRGPPIPA
jgi:hypothetical protein